MSRLIVNSSITHTHTHRRWMRLCQYERPPSLPRQRSKAWLLCDLLSFKSFKSNNKPPNKVFERQNNAIVDIILVTMRPGALQKFERTCKDFPHRKYLKHSYQSLFSAAQFRKKKQVSGEPRTRAVKFKEILTCYQKKKMLTCDRSDFCFAQPACLSFSVLCSVSCCYSSSFS